MTPFPPSRTTHGHAGKPSGGATSPHRQGPLDYGTMGDEWIRRELIRAQQQDLQAMVLRAQYEMECG